MAKVNQPLDIVTRVRNLERDQAAANRGRTLANAVISEGTTEVRSPAGVVLFRAGQIPVSSGATVFGFATYRTNGSVGFWSFDTPTGGGYSALFDERNNILLSNDTVAGQGLARPWLQLRAIQTSLITTGTTTALTTTSASFVSQWTITHYKQHPKITVDVTCGGDSGTTGEVQLYDVTNSVALGTPTAFAAGDSVTLLSPVTGGFNAKVRIDVQVKKTGGVGNVWTAVEMAHGRQS